MEKEDIIIKFLLERVSELTVENKRLNDLVNRLHADCFYYENHWKPIEEDRGEKKEEKEFPF